MPDTVVKDPFTFAEKNLFLKADLMVEMVDVAVTLFFVQIQIFIPFRILDIAKDIKQKMVAREEVQGGPVKMAKM